MSAATEFEELEATDEFLAELDAAERHALAKLDSNIELVPAYVLECATPQAIPKKRRADGSEASPFWGGAVNPDGSKKKVAKYKTSPEKKARAKELEQRAGKERKQVRKLFVQRRDELQKLGRWKGPNCFEKWLMQLAVRVLQGETEAAAAEIPMRWETAIDTMKSIGSLCAKDPDKFQRGVDSIRQRILDPAKIQYLTQ